MKKKPYIMAIDDTPYNLEVLKIILMDMDVEIKCMESGIDAIESIKERIPDLILLDIMMPIMDGYEVCKVLKDKSETNTIPIIFLSALDDVESKVKAFELGGIDYITKPFNTLEVIARVKTHLKLYFMLEEMNTLLRESFHELYTPLGLIKSSLALQELEKGDSEHLQNIKVSVHSLHSIYEDMYYSIKKEVRSYPSKWIDLEQFIQERIKIFQPEMTFKNLKFNMILKMDSPMININQTELERLMDNLLSNAIKYSQQDGLIEIEIVPVNEKIKLSISNSSEKIKDVQKLFDKLYREDHSVMGLGIGLSIVKKICDKYNIDINVESNEKNTSFILYYEEN